MKVLIELEKPDGKILDHLAKEQVRSRTAQAKLMLSEALRKASKKAQAPKPKPKEEA